MKLSSCMLAGCLTVVIVGTACADNDKDKTENNKDKIVGVWKADKLTLNVPLAAKWEFKKDGGVRLFTITEKDVTFSIEEGQVKLNVEKEITPVASGTYKMDKDKLTVTLKMDSNGKELTLKTTITKLTDKEFQTKDEKGKVNKFTKVKEK